ncbi:mechanosensitive ion channel family protein [Ruicaihuangia caeni]|uniref:Mechanosensitive ion channel n=1 Tax=Ruicaihuangia caeni TaxID=3042517 RepID=A0AAW6T3Y4_9MICO|nr:mechanosensitive ion channel domain-containing protein [Klugiella sp. YN-L-19]MDI2097786.1 mechanosensitive ion channel [Klugiella sp. YN-L-19]
MEEFTTFWAGLAEFYETWRIPITAVLVIVGAVVVRLLLHAVIRRVVHRIVTGVKKRNQVEDTQALQASPLAAVRIVQRTRALGGVFNSIVTATVIVVTTLVLIAILLPNATAAFAVISAAVGAGLGFGAQNIVKDILNGLFMVSEDQFGVGDVVDLGPATGVIEHVGIRITHVRDVNGTLWFVRNGEIVRVGNMSLGWARVITDLAVPYEHDIDQVQQLVFDAANDMATNSKWRTRILERPEVWGIESISDEAVIVRVVVKARSSSRDDVGRELRARLKRALDDAGIRLPSLNSVVLSGFEGATSVMGSRPPQTAPLPTRNTAPRRKGVLRMQKNTGADDAHRPNDPKDTKDHG